MTKEQVIYLRNLYGDNGLHIFSDNAKLIDSNADRTKIIWDDINEILHVFQRNISQYNQKTNPYTVQSLGYDTIQYISTNNNDSSLDSIFTILNISGVAKTEIMNCLKGIEE